MILVISEEIDISTDYFMEWCNFKKCPVIRLNEEDSINIISDILMKENRLELKFDFNGTQYNLSDIDAIWFRRGYIRHFSSFQFNYDKTDFFEQSINKYLRNENKTLNNFILYNLNRKYSLGNQTFYNANKLIALNIALQVGLKIPDTLITKSREAVLNHFGQQATITKAIQDAWQVEQAERSFSPVVQNFEIDSEFDQWESFHYSKFQQQIDKKYELRVFFMENQFYASAIFPTDKLNSKVVENKALYPRIIPFSLPDEIIDKLIQFNQLMNLNTGSFDILVDKDDYYYFLEVNPVGQYDYVSKLCNYGLDKKIAEHFKNRINQNV